MRGMLKVGADVAEFAELTISLDLICVETGLAFKGVELTEARLQQRNDRRFQSLVQKSTDLVTLIDRSGNVLYQSPCVYDILGRHAEEDVGSPS